jgi:hypothetical protein
LAPENKVFPRVDPKVSVYVLSSFRNLAIV